MEDLSLAAEEASLHSLAGSTGVGLLTSILRFSTDGIAFIDPNLIIRAANERFAQQVRRPLEQIMGHPGDEVTPGWTGQVGRIYEQVRGTGQPFHAEAYPFIFQEQPERGTTHWDTTVAPVCDPDGTFRGWLLAQREVTERVRAEEAHEALLREVERRAAELDTILTSVADGLAVFNAAGELIRLSPSAARILGCRLEDGERSAPELAAALHLRTPEDQPFLPEQLPALRALRGQETHGAIMVAQRNDGRALWVQVSAAPIRGPDGSIAGAVVTFSDITAIHELEERREDILRAVSHDLRSPLTTVLGQAQLLHRRLEQAGRPARDLESARAVVAGARRMNTMIQDLVDSARMESGQLRLSIEPLDMRGFLGDLMKRLSTVMDIGRVRARVPEGLPPVLADTDRLERIMTNLLSNALKYSPAESEVTVTVRREGDQLITAAIDRGPGIPAEDLPRLFQRYVRAAGSEARREGLGLGLYITRILVEAHRGHIWVESEPGRGSTFSFSLPLAEG